MCMRKEIRYSIKYPEYIQLKQILEVIMKKDENSMINGKYEVKTIYFDNYRNEMQNDKKNDINSVNKYRIRMYNNNEESIFLERKCNENGNIKKIKQKIERKEVEDILNGKYKNLLEENASLKIELYLQMQLKQLRPIFLIGYERIAFVDEISNTRITIEDNIKSTINCNRFFDKIEGVSKNNYILEVKYEKYIPDYIKNVISNLKNKEIVKSKFRNETEKYQIWG